MKAAGTLVAASLSPGSILHHPGVRVGHGGSSVVVKRALVRPNSNSAEFRASVVLNHSCYVVLGLNWPWDPSLNPGNLELQFPG